MLLADGKESARRREQEALAETIGRTLAARLGVPATPEHATTGEAATPACNASANLLQRARIEYILRDQSGFAPCSLDRESLVALLVWAWEDWYMPLELQSAYGKKKHERHIIFAPVPPNIQFDKNAERRFYIFLHADRFETLTYFVNIDLWGGSGS
jgi:hypothetical protein